MRARTWLTLIVLVSVVLALTIIAWLAGANAGDAQNFNQGLSNLADAMAGMRWWLTLFRAAIVALIVWQWRWVVLWAYPSTVPQFEEKRAALWHWRWRVVIGFILVEAVLVHNILGFIIGSIV